MTAMRQSRLPCAEEQTNLSGDRESFIRPAWLRLTILVMMFLSGLAIRLYDLTDPPLDFHETRQLGSAIIARGMYYQKLSDAPEEIRARAVRLWHRAPVYEPQILERLVAITYRIAGGENLWIARIYSSIFWVLGGVGVFLISRRIHSFDGALVATAFFLFIPYTVIASRSFQPDPLMTCLIIYAVLALHHWGYRSTWRWTFISGMACGFAILVKAVALFPVLCSFAALAIYRRRSLKMFLDLQIWAIALLSLAPGLVYHFFGIQARASGLFEFWVTSFRSLTIQPSFYIRWTEQINYVMGFEAFVLALIGVLAIQKGKDQGLLLGLWTGYFLYGLALPYQIMTHDYYHLMIIPIAAISLSALAAIVYQRLATRSVSARLALGLIMLFAVAAQAWNARLQLARSDYREEVKGWVNLGKALPRDGGIIALTHAYGFRLEYYGWTDVQLWPYVADMEVLRLSGKDAFNFEAEFKERIKGMNYFLVTHFSELDRQPSLKAALYEGYPIYLEGDGYLVFDLSKEFD